MNPKITCCFFILTLLLTNCQTTSPNYPKLARQLNDEMENAFRTGKLKKLAAMYSDDGYLLSPNRKATHGRKAIDAYWERWHTPINWQLDVIAVSTNEQDIYESEYWKNLKEQPKHWSSEGIEIGDAEVFYQLGHSKIEYESDDGMHKTSHVDFVLVWILEADGQYRILVDTYI